MVRTVEGVQVIVSMRRSNVQMIRLTLCEMVVKHSAHQRHNHRHHSDERKQPRSMPSNPNHCTRIIAQVQWTEIVLSLLEG